MSPRLYALFLLALACAHEFAWQAGVPGTGQQGNIRNVTLWPLICYALWGVGLWLKSDRFAVAVCIAVAVMTSTTALCSAWWLIEPFTTPPGGVQCSRQLQFPIILLSCIAATAVFWLWGPPRGRKS